MQRLAGALAIAIVMTASLATLRPLAQTSPPTPEPDSGSVVCVPAAYPKPPSGCLPLGPSIYLTQLAQIGLSLPPGPLPSAPPDRSLADLAFRYFHVISETPVSIGSSPGASGGDSLFPGFVYIGYTERLQSDQGVFYMLENGGWIPGKGEQVGEIPSFQGLTFSRTPGNSFGWTFEYIPVLSAPGYGASPTGRNLLPFSVVQIYATESRDGADWNMIGLNQWVEARKVAQVDVNTQPPEGSSNASRWIDVNLAEQTLAVYDNGQLVFATMIASGVEPFWTRPGLFQIVQKKPTETMRNNDPSDFYYLEDVPWTMYYDGPRALHGAYWRLRFGYPQSHGCVNLSVGDAHWLFDWAHEGDWVYVHDPTGKTPTDPALYQGGAY
jgi:hypothetical protein